MLDLTFNSDEESEFYRRIMMLVHHQPPDLYGHYQCRKFRAAGLFVEEAIRTASAGTLPREAPQDGDSYMLEVMEGSGYQRNVVLCIRRIPSDSEFVIEFDTVAVYRHIGGIRQLTVLDDLASS